MCEDGGSGFVRNVGTQYMALHNIEPPRYPHTSDKVKMTGENYMKINLNICYHVTNTGQITKYTQVFILENLKEIHTRRRSRR
jgi:hypothetical protein